MGLDNPVHIAFLLVLLLLVFGAKRLPEMGRSLGSGLRGFRDALTGDVRTAASPAPLATADAAPAALVATPSADAVAAATASDNGGSHEPLAA